jgi:hypothetical protein
VCTDDAKPIDNKTAATRKNLLPMVQGREMQNDSHYQKISLHLSGSRVGATIPAAHHSVCRDPGNPIGRRQAAKV